VTTHNPLVLDALALADDNVRLFAVDRNAVGHTVVHRVVYTDAVKLAQERGLTLSQMWTRGLLGAVHNSPRRVNLTHPWLSRVSWTSKTKLMAVAGQSGFSTTMSRKVGSCS
jgi:hypothetical protein